MDDEAFEAYVEDLARRGEAIARDVQAGKNDPETQRTQQAYRPRGRRHAGRAEPPLAVSDVRGGGGEPTASATENPRLVAACGEEPEGPEAPLSPPGPEGVLARKGAAAAGLTPNTTRSCASGCSTGPTRTDALRMGFSVDEMAVLTGKKTRSPTRVKALRKAKVPL